MKEEKKKDNFKTKKITKALYYLILSISIISLIFAFLLLIKWRYDNHRSKKIAEDVNNITDITNVYDTTLDENKNNDTSSNNENIELVNPPPSNVSNDYWDFIKMPLISVNFNELLKRNKDTVGWINVNNTNINYPVVQTSNNEDYLYKAFDGSSNQAGWIFADYRNNMKDFDKNTIIYGHSRLNNTMFGSLLNVVYSSWYTNKYNQVIRFSTPTENTMWQVFSTYKINVETYYLTTTFYSDTNYLEFLNTLANRSIYKFNVPLNENDKILTLSTCSDAKGTGRIVLHAKLIKKEKRI